MCVTVIFHLYSYCLSELSVTGCEINKNTSIDILKHAEAEIK